MLRLRLHTKAFRAALHILLIPLAILMKGRASLFDQHFPLPFPQVLIKLWGRYFSRPPSTRFAYDP
jgi:hypothetical protein